MKNRKPSPKQILCHELGAEDGADPRTFFRRPTHKRLNRKALQLCGQIARTLSAVLAWESADELLRSLGVESVTPAPDSTRVLVTVWLHPSAGAANAHQVLEHLHRFSGKLRSEIAAAIHRKRVPELVFRVAGQGAVSQ
jgi:ribosome-binding factor A